VEAVLRAAVRVVMEPALRLIQGDARQWSDQTRSCPVIRGIWAVRHQADVRNVGSRTPVRGSVLTTRAELLRLPVLPDRGVAEPLGDGLLHPLLLSCGASTAPSGLEPPDRLHS